MTDNSDESTDLQSHSPEAVPYSSIAETPPTADDIDCRLRQAADDFKFLTFDDCVDQWRTYIHRLEYELTKVGLMTEKAQQYRRDLLLKFMSVKLKNLAIDHFSPRSMNDVTYEEIVAFFDDHFETPSILRCRISFGQYVRQTHHTVGQFLNELRALAETCDFQSTMDERIRDQFLVGLNDCDMLDKIIAQHRGHNATLKEIETTALYVEGTRTRPTTSNTESLPSTSSNSSTSSTVNNSGCERREGLGQSTKRDNFPGYSSPVKLSPELAALVGKDKMPRYKVIKKVWAIIEERNLRDPKNKHFVICDDELERILGVKRFRSFGVMKFLKYHFCE